MQEEHNIAKTSGTLYNHDLSKEPTTHSSVSFQSVTLESRKKEEEWIPVSAAWLTSRGLATTWVITNDKVKKKIKNINYLVVNSNNAGKVCLKDMASKLVSEIGITRLLVEGGGVLITELMKHSLIDRLIICRSGKILGNDAIPFIGNLGIQSINNCYQFKKVEIIEFSEDVIEL